MNFYERVYCLVRQIPQGKCVSYGQIALLLGSPRAARAVGYALRACREPGVPCHRVLRADGSASCAFGPGVQRSLLEAEGVAFTAEGRVDWTRSMWDGHLRRGTRHTEAACRRLLILKVGGVDGAPVLLAIWMRA